MTRGRKAKYIRAAVSLMLIFVMLLCPFCFAYAEGMEHGAAETITDDDLADGSAVTANATGDSQNDAEPSKVAADPEDAKAPDEITDADIAGGSDRPDKSDRSDDELALIDKVSIPVIVIHIDETKGTIDAMNSDDTHKTECYGTMDIIVPEGFGGYADMDIMPQTIRDIRLDYIRLRGNSTSRQPKKPYKIKLKKPKAGQEPANMLGLGTGRHWALVANVMDPVQIRNRITYRLGEELGFEYNPKCVPVDVIMKSNTDSSHDVYLGTYYLSENIRVDEDRLNITEPGESETSPDKITGDYLIQGGQQTANDSPDRFRTDRGVILANDTPSYDPGDDGYDNDTQKEYIRNHIQHVEDAVFGEDFKGEDGVRYNELMDMKTAADYWLVQMVTNNPDAYGTGSMYFYKVSDTFDADGNKTATGKIYWGPLWDFDIAYGEQDIETVGFEFYNPWITAMLYDKDKNGFLETVKKEWPAVKESLLAMTEDGGIIDQYRDELRVSRSQDFDLWKDEIPYFYSKTDDSYDNDQDYDQKIENLKAWIKNRVAWMDKYFSDGSIDTAVCRVMFVVDGKTDHIEYYPRGRDIQMYIPDMEENEYQPHKEGYVFLGWEKEDGSLVTDYESAVTDKVYTARFVREDEATLADEVLFRFDEEWCSIGDNYFNSFYTVLPADAQDKSVTWSSSDDSIAVVEKDGKVILRSPGTVTITATLKSGVKSSYKLTILEGSQPRLESVEMEPEEMVLKVGESAKLNVTLRPKQARVSYLTFFSDDSEIASVDYSTGVVTGVRPGTVMIHMETAGSNDSNMRAAPLEVEKICKVTVVEAKDDDSGDGSGDGGSSDGGSDNGGTDNSGGDSAAPGGSQDSGDSASPGGSQGNPDNADNTSSGGSGDSGKSGNSNAVRTGDDTHLMLYAGILLAAIAEGLLLFILRKRGKHFN